MEAAAVGAAGALVTDQVMYNNDVLSKDSAMALGLGAATAVGLPLAWAGGKKLKTSIYTGLKARASAKEAASKVADIFNGKAGVSEIGSI
jgi:hypothetical protein